MTRRTLLIAAAALATAFFTNAAVAQTLYVANIRSQAAASSPGLLSGLYTVNLSTGSATFSAPLRVQGVKPVAVTGLAVHPTTGLLYGITSELSPNMPRSLVTIDAASGDASPVGELAVAGSDIVFDAAGTLYMWMPLTRQLAQVNIANAAVTALGAPGPQEAMGGLAIDARGVAYVTPSGANGTLDTVDLKSGRIQSGPTLSGAPFAGAITAMTFTPTGMLLGVNSNVGAPAHARLVAINTATGAISTLGTLPDDSDALTFAPAPRDIVQVLATMSGRTLALLALILGSFLALAGVAIVKALGRR